MTIENVKTLLCDKRNDFTFPTVIFPFISKELTFHSSYVILELVSSIEILWTELSCWHKSCSNNDTLLLGWSYRYKHSTVVITVWLTVTRYLYLKWLDILLLRDIFISNVNGYFPFLRSFFVFPLSPTRFGFFFISIDYIYIYIYTALLLSIYIYNHLKICNSSENVSTRMLWKIRLVFVFFY